MYKFRDTVDNSRTGVTLPAEAMSYDGVFLENEIQGYRTLYISGRELLECEVQNETVNLIDGANYLGKRYPSRTLTVTYQLIAKNDYAFREAYNKLNLLLSGEQVKVIFNDEPDKYFIGTKVGNTDPTPGRNSVTGAIEIYCSDPFKYSTVLKEFKASTNADGVFELNIQNNGSIPVPIDYEVTMNSESGFLGLVSENGTMQFGKTEEADGENYRQNEMLVHLNNFINNPNDINGTDYLHPLYGTKGTLGTATWFGKQFLKFGTAGEMIGRSNGGLRTVTIPADSEGDRGAKNWYAYFHVLFYAGLMGQTGEMSVSFLTEDNKLIAAYNWNKTDTTGNTGHCEFICYNPNAKPNDILAGKVLKQWAYTTSHLQNQNPWYWNWGHCDLRKEGNKLTFYYSGGYYTYTVPEIENMECTKIQIAMKQWEDRGGPRFMTYLGFDVFQFTKMNVEKWKDVPNRYPQNTVLKIDGKESKFYVNDMSKPNDEILGTQYFKAKPGSNKVQVAVSEWTKTAPTVQAKIREAWL